VCSGFTGELPYNMDSGVERVIFLSAVVALLGLWAAIVRR
jgi:hypothetical protein